MLPHHQVRASLRVVRRFYRLCRKLCRGFFAFFNIYIITIITIIIFFFFVVVVVVVVVVIICEFTGIRRR